MYIYPKLAEKVTFWCLFGKKKIKAIENSNISIIISDELISALEEKKSTNNAKETKTIIMEINLLKKGLDPAEQQFLSQFMK